MKYTIEGFYQPKLVELKMDLIDAVILRWFIDFKDTGKMYSEIIDNDKYYWIKYDQVIEDLPIISLVKTSLGKRVRRLAEIGVLKHYTKKQNGTFSLYAIGENYAPLIDFEIKKEEKELDFDEIKGIKKSKGVPQNEQALFLEMNTGCSSEGTTNNSSIKITNLLKKSNQKKSDSDFVIKAKTKPSVIKMLALDKNLLLDQKFINSLRIYDIEFLRDLFAKVPEGTNNPTGYLISCLKNNPQPKVEKIKKVEVKEPVEVIEEPKEKASRDEIISNFCKEMNCSKDNMQTFLKNILNTTLEGLNYARVS